MSAGDLDVGMPDSAAFTEHGRRLLVALGVVNPDPLRVEAEGWLLRRPFGPMTVAAFRVRVALGAPWPDEFFEATARMRRTR